jgi:hypothetical protein
MVAYSPLAITMTLPLSAPETVGENFRASVQLVPGAIAVVVVQSGTSVFPSNAWVYPLGMLMPPSVTDDPVMLVISAVAGELDVLTAWLPKAKLPS